MRDTGPSDRNDTRGRSRGRIAIVDVREETEREGRNEGRQGGSARPDRERTPTSRSKWDQRRDRARENNDRQVEMDWEEEEREKDRRKRVDQIRREGTDSRDIDKIERERARAGLGKGVDRDAIETIERSRAMAGLGRAGTDREGIEALEQSRAMAGLGKATQDKAQDAVRKDQRERQDKLVREADNPRGHQSKGTTASRWAAEEEEEDRQQEKQRKKLEGEKAALAERAKKLEGENAALAEREAACAKIIAEKLEGDKAAAKAREAGKRTEDNGHADGGNEGKPQRDRRRREDDELMKGWEAGAMEVEKQVPVTASMEQGPKGTGGDGGNDDKQAPTEDAGALTERWRPRNRSRRRPGREIGQ